MNPCEAIREQAQARLDGDLTPDEQARFDAHLAACEVCRRLVAGYRALFAALDAPAIPAPPAAFVGSVLRRVGAARRRRAAWQAGAAVAAALVAAAAVLALVWNDAVVGAAAGAAAGLADVEAGEVVSGAWPALGEMALGLLEWASQGLAAAPGGLAWAAAVLALLGADVLLAYHWRFLAKLNGGHKMRATR